MKRWGTVYLVALWCGIFAPGGAAHVAQGEPRTVSVVLTVPNSDPVRPVAFEVEPARGVVLVTATPASLADGDQITLLLTVPATVQAGWFSAATVSLIYPDDHRITAECQVWVPPEKVIWPLEPVAPLPEAQEPWARWGFASEPGLPVAIVAAAPQVTTGFGLRRPAPGADRGRLGGTVYVGATELDTRGRSDAEFGMGIDLDGRLKGSTQVRAIYIHGWNPGVSPVFRYGMHRSRAQVRVKGPRFSAEAGEIRPDNPLAGVRAVADGASFVKTGGPLMASFAIGKPKHFAGGWGGHLVQGSVGVRFGAGSISLLASDLSRPVGQARITANPPPDEESELIEEDLERVGALLSRENRVRSRGIETSLTLGKHNFVGRAGWLELVNTGDERTTGLAAGGTYSFSTKRGSLTGQFRTSPPSLPGAALLGDLASLSGKLTLVEPLALIGQVYWNESQLFGRSGTTRGLGGTAGIQYLQDQTRFYLQGKYRESEFLSASTARSVVAGLRSPLGSVAGLDAAVEYGEAHDGRRRRPIANYRGSVYLENETASLMLSGNYRDYGLSRPRLSLDASGSLTLRRATIEGGAGISRAGIFGDVASAWGTIEIPVRGDLTIMLGADYDRWSFEDSPYLVFLEADDSTPPWRFTFNVRRKLSVPLPFLK